MTMSVQPWIKPGYGVSVGGSTSSVTSNMRCTAWIRCGRADGDPPATMEEAAGEEEEGRLLAGGGFRPVRRVDLRANEGAVDAADRNRRRPARESGGGGAPPAASRRDPDPSDPHQEGPRRPPHGLGMGATTGTQREGQWEWGGLNSKRIALLGESLARCAMAMRRWGWWGCM